MTAEGLNHKGGLSPVNDCLFQCLKFYCKNLPWSNDYYFKKFLGVQPLEMIEVKHIPTIEKRLKIGINISGDYVYTSTLKLKQIFIKLENNHYSIDYQTTIYKSKKYNGPLIQEEKDIVKDYRKQLRNFINENQENILNGQKIDFPTNRFFKN